MTDDSHDDDQSKQKDDALIKELEEKGKLESYSASAISNIFKRELTPLEFDYLKRCYPYIEIENYDSASAHENSPSREVTESGWIVIDRQDSLLAGPPIFGRGPFSSARRDEDDEGEGGTWGTTMAQALDAVNELILVAMYREWGAIRIVGGTENLQQYAWMKACDQNIKVYDFAASKDAMRRYEQDKFIRESEGAVFKSSSDEYKPT